MKINIKLFLLMLGTSISLSACESEKKISSNENIISNVDVNSNKEDIINNNNNLEYVVTDDITVNEQVENIRSINDTLCESYLVVINKVNLRSEDNTDSDILDILPIGFKFSKYEKINDWYLVNYNGINAYVHSSCVKEKQSIEFPYDFKKVVYLNADKELFDSLELDNSNQFLSKLECCEVYEEFDNSYLVKTNDKVGYISKNDTEELLDTFVVVDISDQELKLYENNSIILTSPVVTGKPSSPSDQGLFEIYDITHNRYLIGPNYKTYVDIMMKYNGGEGLHDAEYHTNDDGFKHGWRNREDFGGETYLKNGSHGCVNMPWNEVMEVYKHVDLGTKVLVKE